MKILVRLPNWLGDLVMSVALVRQLPYFFPGAEVSVIVKKGIHELIPFFPPLQGQHIFSKEEFKGVRGAINFGRQIGAREKFDLFLCLPNSFSAALIGFASGAEKRVGYKKELRQLLLTDVYPQPSNLHRVEEYIHLAALYSGLAPMEAEVRLDHSFAKGDHIVVNINSEASSRRLTVSKAVELLSAVRAQTTQRIILIGAPKEKAWVDAVMNTLPHREGIENLAGATTLTGLVELLASAKLLLTTDSGPAHLANALGTYTIVLFGAGREADTAPYHSEWSKTVRLNALSCEPCERNECVRFGIPQCLERLDVNLIVQLAKTGLA